MNKLYLDVSHEMDEEIDFPFYRVDIVINGQRLIDLAREVELPFAEAEGRLVHAGEYQNLPPRAVFLPSRSWLPENGEEITELLICGFCGTWGCWPLEARITVEDERVVWSDFCQPHRSKSKPPVWRYDRLGPFVFDRRQYEAELGKMLADETYQEAKRRWEEWLTNVRKIR